MATQTCDACGAPLERTPLVVVGQGVNMRAWFGCTRCGRMHCVQYDEAAFQAGIERAATEVQARGNLPSGAHGLRPRP